jgi:hypothetical protein
MIKHWPVLFRAVLYFLIALLPVFIKALFAVAHGTIKISSELMRYWWASIACEAGYQGLVALRAFFDGTAQRAADARSGNGNGHPPVPPILAAPAPALPSPEKAVQSPGSGT